MLTSEMTRERIIATLDDIKALDVDVIDVRERTNMTDWMVICTGSSNRHTRSAAQSLDAAFSEAGEPPLGIEGMDSGEWVLVDLGDAVVHIMLRETRDYYQLERLWEAGPEAPATDGAQSA